MIKYIITQIFNNVRYWQDKEYLLRAIPYEIYDNPDVILALLWINDGVLSSEYEAKKEMWNHMIISAKMGDDILHRVSYNILDDKDFALQAIHKYNRAYLFLNKTLRLDYEIAASAALNELPYKTNEYTAPIMMYMPEEIQDDMEISSIACTRNIHNLQYAKKLQSNKYFIIDIMNKFDSTEDKRVVLKYIDQSLLEDKLFVSKLGCFDNMCDQFQGDILYVSNAVKYDIDILKKTELFDQSIIESVIESKYYQEDFHNTIKELFRYIKRFNDDIDELNEKIINKSIISKLFWDMGEDYL